MWNIRKFPFKLLAVFLGAVLLFGSGIVPQVYQFVTANGGSANQGNTLNFGNTTTVTWTCSTTSGVTTCSATATGAAVSTLTINNASSTGTTVNTLTKLTGAPSTAVISATSDTGGAIGITTAGAGTTGAATIAIAGQVSCVFDGATTAGDYIQISSTTAGNCHDGLSTYPSSGQVIGRVLSTNASGGTYTLDLFPSEIQGSSAPSALALSIATKTTTYTYASTDYAINCNATSGGFTTSLEASPTTGRVHVFKKIDSSTNICTLSGNGNNIDTGATVATNVQDVSYTVQFDGTQWWIQ